MNKEQFITDIENYLGRKGIRFPVKYWNMLDSLITDERQQAIAEHEQGKNKLPTDFKCVWLTDLTDCAYRDIKCHICTKAGFEPEIKNYFAPFKLPKPYQQEGGEG